MFGAKEIISFASAKLMEKSVRAMFIATKHFEERLFERFNDEDLEQIERTVLKAFEKCSSGNVTKYTHPVYGITVVAQKMGSNCMELMTCYKGVKKC